MNKVYPIDHFSSAEQNSSTVANHFLPQESHDVATESSAISPPPNPKLASTITSVAALLVRYMILMQEDQHYQRELQLKEQKESYALSKKAVSSQYNSALCLAVGTLAMASIVSFGLTLDLSPHFRGLIDSGVQTSRNVVPFLDSTMQYFLGNITPDSMPRALKAIAPVITNNASMANQASQAASGAYAASQTQFNNEATLLRGHCEDAKTRAQAVKEQLRQVESLFEKCVELSRSAAPRG